MNIYHYNNTREYIGEGLADKDPLDNNNYLLPANSTKTKPPATKTGTVAKWSGDKWEVVPDHRGKTVYEKATTSPVTVDYIGELKNEHTDTKPPKKYVEWKGKWVDRPLTKKEQEQKNQNKIAELKQYLADTDYTAIKKGEGVIKEGEYEEIFSAREDARAEINKLEAEIEKLKEKS